MSSDEGRSEDVKILSFREKVAAQTFRVRTLHVSAIQKAHDRKVLDAMRQNEAQAILNRALTRNVGDPFDVPSAEAAE